MRLRAWHGLFLLPLCLLAAGPARSAEPPPVRAGTTIVYGDDPCPRSSGDEIVVCARRPESERYRIPKELREKHKPGEFSERSWADRLRTVEEATRFTMPNSCSVVGSGGQTGCIQMMIRQWLEERRQFKAEMEAAP